MGTHNFNWATEDCGNHVKALNHGRNVDEFIFHPTENRWALAAAWSKCDDFVNEPCSI